MTKRPVNDKQRRVIDWLAGGGSQDPLDPTMKRSAGALQDRGLLRIRRSGGTWTAELTDAGHYLAEHGMYPPGPAPTARPKRSRPRSPKPAERATEPRGLERSGSVPATPRSA